VGLPLVLLEAPLALHGLVAEGAEGGREARVLHRHVAGQVPPVHHFRAVRAVHHVPCNTVRKATHL